MMKKTLLSCLIGASIVGSVPSFANQENTYFQSVYQDTYEQINQRIEALRQLAMNDENVIVEDGVRYLVVNDSRYKLNKDNYLRFEATFPNFYDETTFRNVFDFLDSSWELTWYEGGMIAVNKTFGNYDWDQGCLLEYVPNGFIGNSGVERVLMETDTCSLNDFNKEVAFITKPEKIELTDFEQNGFEVTAVDTYQNRLYVTHSKGGEGTVSIYDLASQALLGTIDGYEKDGVHHAYNVITELNVHDDKLYISSLSANRVDIFDLTNDHAHVMSLGTGEWNGENAIVHAQASAANQDYVFVSDAMGINVYRQQDATPENHGQLGRYASLRFGNGQDTYRKVQMHVIGDYLIANVMGREYYIYDITQIENSVATPLEPVKVVSSAIQKMALLNDSLMVSEHSKLRFQAVDDFIANDFQFSETAQTIEQISGTSVGNHRDIALTDQYMVLANDEALSIARHQNKAIQFVADKSVETSKISFDSIPAMSVSKILQNDESYDTLINEDLRSVRVNSLVKTELLDHDMIKITSYVAQDLTDINIEMRFNGLNKWFTLGNFDRIPAFTQIILPLSAFGDQYQFNSANRDGVFDLSEFVDSGLDIKAALTTRFSSDTDKFAQVLTSLKPSWNLVFAPDWGGNWRSINGLYAREWIVIMTNFAYMISQEEFKHLWFNFNTVFGHDMSGPNSQEDVFTAEEYQHYYDGMLARDKIQLGVVNYGGLGGLSGYGVFTPTFYSHYYGEWEIVPHEFGHGSDGKTFFPDGSSFAASWFGWQPFMHALGNYHIRKGDLPYMDDKISGFFKEENAAYRYDPIQDWRRTYRADTHMNTVDTYFMSFSTMPQGWFENNSTFDLNQLSKQERLILARFNVEGNSEYACRFNFVDGDDSVVLYGHVKQDENGDRTCIGGDALYFQKSDGSKAEIVSPLNQFDWLSLHKPESHGEPVVDSQGATLCSTYHAEFYGMGYQTELGQCVQDERVRVQNGNHWLLGSHVSSYFYN
ncbi:hypothetical protein RJD40_11105 [Vibrio scophthalmi]|uniref:YncE family protein n=1 Tax=Vibrio scophthalmi TaxID=45658 RepID=UPI003AAE12C5